MIKSNGGCELPCVWGATPGQSDASVLIETMARFGVFETETYYTYHHIDWCSFFAQIKLENTNDFLRLQIGCDATANTIKIIGITLEAQSSDFVNVFTDPDFKVLTHYYSISNILNTYGKPEEVLIGTWGEDPFLKATYTPFSVVLVYEQRGILFEYISPMIEVGSSFTGCPQEGRIRVVAWDPTSPPAFSEIADNSSSDGYNSLGFEYFKSLADATGISLDEFYRIYSSESNTECLLTPSSMWLNP